MCAEFPGSALMCTNDRAFVCITNQWYHGVVRASTVVVAHNPNSCVHAQHAILL